MPLVGGVGILPETVEGTVQRVQEARSRLSGMNAAGKDAAGKDAAGMKAAGKSVAGSNATGKNASGKTSEVQE